MEHGREVGGGKKYETLQCEVVLYTSNKKYFLKIIQNMLYLYYYFIFISTQFWFHIFIRQQKEDVSFHTICSCICDFPPPHLPWLHIGANSYKGVYLSCCCTLDYSLMAFSAILSSNYTMGHDYEIQGDTITVQILDIVYTYSLQVNNVHFQKGCFLLVVIPECQLLDGGARSEAGSLDMVLVPEMSSLY